MSSNLACKGLLLTAANIDKDSKNGDDMATNPEQIIRSKGSTWNNVDNSKMDEKDVDTSVAKCRAWYDANNYGKPFCCQMQIAAGEWDANVVDSTSTVVAEPFERETSALGVSVVTKYSF